MKSANIGKGHLWKAFPYILLKGKGLGSRMENALNELLESHNAAALIGEDSPQIDVFILNKAFAFLRNHSTDLCADFKTNIFESGADKVSKVNTDYEDAVQREFGHIHTTESGYKAQLKPTRGIPVWVTLTATFILLQFLYQMFKYAYLAFAKQFHLQ